MSGTFAHSQDAITEEEISSTTVPPSSEVPIRNAFTALMSSKPKAHAGDTHASSRWKPQVFQGADGLGAYTANPEKYDSSRVIYYNDDFVIINDLFPKSSIHLLVLPRSPRNLLHPFDAFEDPDFLASVQKEVKKVRTLVAKELRRRYGKFSAKDKAREDILNGEVDIPERGELPEGRDWEKDVMSGIHAHPSMNHLHIHVMSVDRYSDCLKHRKHYNSFTTPFFIDVTDFPLAKDDVRRHPGREGYLDADLKCWRCGRNFGHKFAPLKRHLEEEFEKWKAD